MFSPIYQRYGAEKWIKIATSVFGQSKHKCLQLIRIFQKSDICVWKIIFPSPLKHLWPCEQFLQQIEISRTFLRERGRFQFVVETRQLFLLWFPTINNKEYSNIFLDQLANCLVKMLRLWCSELLDDFNRICNLEFRPQFRCDLTDLM